MTEDEAREADHYRLEDGEWWYYPPSGVRARAATGTCEWCEERWVRNNAPRRANRFCGNECYREWRREQRKGICEQCGDEYIQVEYPRDNQEGREGDEQRFCSLECYWEWNTGENHTHYSGFSGEQYRKIRSQVEGKWGRNRRKALERDDNHCQMCGEGGYLDVHHITPLLQGGTNKLDNLVTLCRKCHRSLEPRGHDYTEQDWKVAVSTPQLSLTFDQ